MVATKGCTPSQLTLAWVLALVVPHNFQLALADWRL